MGQVQVRDLRSGRVLSFAIGGETATPGELKAIEAQMRATPGPQMGPRGTRDQPSRSGLLPQNLEDLSPLVIGGMGMAGSALGAGAGLPGLGLGALPGAAIGGALGTATGSLAMEGLADVGRATGFIGGPDALLGESVKPRGSGIGGPFGPTRRALGEAAMDLAVPSALSGVVGGTKRFALSRIGKTIPDAGRRIAAYAEELGVPLGVENVTTSRILQRTRDILGRIPILSREFAVVDIRQAKGLARVKAQLLNDLSPIVTTTTDLGGEISEAAFRRSKTVGAEISAMYDDWLDRATREGARIPAETTRQVARDLLDSFQKNLPTRMVKVKKEMVPKAIDVSAVGIDTSVLSFAKQLSTLQEMSPRQFKTLQTTLNAILEEKSENRAVMRQVTLLKGALESDLENVNIPALATQIKGLNATFGQYMQLLESPTGSRIAQATGGLGKIFTTRTQQPDRLFQTIYDTKSPQALSELSRLIGRQTFSKAVANHVEDVFEQTILRAAPGEDIGKQLVNIRDLRRKLGVTRERSPERAAFAHSLKLAGGPSIAEFERFFDVAEAALSSKKIDISTFLARRVVLGGVRSGLRAVNPMAIFAGSSGGGAAVGGASGAAFASAGPLGTALGAALSVMGVVAVRRGTRLLTRPGVLQAATRLMDPNLRLSQRNELIARLGRIGGQDFVRDLIAAGKQMLDRALSPQQTEALVEAPQSPVQIR